MSPRGCLILLFVGATTALGLGQPAPQSDPKDPKTTETPKKIPLEKMKLPTGSIFVVVEDIKEALLFGRMALMKLEEYQALADKLAALEKKTEKKAPHSCRLAGKVNGDHVGFDVEFTFSTEKPNTTVVLGLQGAHLTKEGRLNGQIPHVDFGDDGFVVQVENPGEHHLSLSMELPVGPRRSGAAAGGPERGFDLGLPGAAVTTFALDLPQGVKDLRWNDNAEKRRRSGRWEFALPARTKTINVVWKEPITSPGGGPLLSVEGQVLVVVDETQVLITADLSLEPKRGQVSEWQLLLPPQAQVDVKSAGGLPAEIVPADKKGALHLLKLKEPSSERLQVVAQVRYPRAGGVSKLPIGPFAVIGAHEQSGTIRIKATPEALRGARLVYHRHGEISQRDVPKPAPGADPIIASFQYWSLPGIGKPGPATKSPRGVPLELEIKAEKGQVETQVEHRLRLQRVAEGYQVEATTRIKASGLYGPVDFLDVQLPRLPTEPFAALMGNAAAPYPATLPWGPLFWTRQPPGTAGVPIEYTCEGEGGPDLQPADIFRRARIKLSGLRGKDFSIVLGGKYVLPRQALRARLELLRPLGIVDHGGKVTITTAVDDHLELLSDSGEAVPERHQQIIVSDQAPRFVNLAWRPYTPEFTVSAETDVEIRDGFARVRHQVTVPPSAREAAAQKAARRVVVFRFPATLQGFKIDGKFPEERGVARATVSARDNQTLLCEYDFVLPAGNGEGARVFDVPLVWPEHATRVDAKVRVWCEPGTVPALAKAALANQIWKSLGPEIVAQRDSLPALVLSGSGVNLPLVLRLGQPAPARHVELFLDEGLIQVAVDEEGHHYRARFLVRRFNNRQVDIELPAPAQTAIQKVRLDGKALPYRADGNMLHIQVDPELYSEPVFLELDYHVPASMLEGQPAWQTQFHPPTFRGDVFLKRVGWQISLAPGMTPLVTGRNTFLEYRWAFRHGVFTPEAVSGGDGSPGTWPSPTLTLVRPSLTTLRVVQLPWQAWFLICSGTLVLIGLALSLAPLPRWAVWLVIGLLFVGILLARFLAPALFPMLLYGSQPGVIVVLLILLVQWMVHERYRRQLVFLPGFMRVQSGSSLIRAGSSGRQREPTTVDAPPSSKTGPGAPAGQGT